jgi:3-oxoacyl-[acyl-carrier protein] reductase
METAFRSTGAEVALVTGAAGGIGAAIARAFLASGARVVGADLSESAGGERAELDVRSCDVASEPAVAELFAHVSATHGRLDFLVHAAGIAGGGRLTETRLDEWMGVVDASLTASFLLARAFHPLLKSAAGAVVLVGSSNGFNGGSQLSGPAYAAAKAGVHNLVRYLAKEWAPDGIRVNAVAPGPVDTPMVQRYGEATRGALRRAVPLGREGSPEEIAANVLFLCSRQAAWQTGSVVNVSGGLVL